MRHVEASLQRSVTDQVQHQFRLVPVLIIQMEQNSFCRRTDCYCLMLLIKLPEIFRVLLFVRRHEVVQCDPENLQVIHLDAVI